MKKLFNVFLDPYLKNDFSENRKTPKTGFKHAPGAQTPKIRTRRGETNSGASLWTVTSKPDFSESRKTPKTGLVKAPRAQTPKIRTRRGDSGPGASFWTFTSKTVFFPKIEKRQKRCRNRLQEPKLRKFEPEGGKPDLAHLFGPASQTKSEISKTNILKM